jgi:dihydroorotate dehydrogenase electron transfer subunit
LAEPIQRSPAYADHAWQGTVAIENNARVARDTYLLEFACPEIARRIVPGQFMMVRIAGTDDPLLGRPLALYDVVPNAAGERATRLQIVYLVVGKMTRRLATLTPGTPLEIWGPLGNGFPAQPTSHLVMVAGGIGQTPFLALGREYLGGRAYGDPPRKVPPASNVTLLYGARNEEFFAGVNDFRRAGIDVHLSTDDGSRGHHGLVTDLIRPVVEASDASCRLVGCGPEPMLTAVARIARQLQLPCQVSLETPMACGIGICFSCVARVRDASGNWDYRRTCVEGPVFEADEIEF